MGSEWKRRIKLFVQRFWQPTSACMTCMPGSWGNIMSLAHWSIAFRTGLLTGILTAIGDSYSHTSHYRIHFVEHIVTGVMSGLFALAASFLLEDRARRIRVVWGRLFG
jgi:hypothetical protein